MKKYLLAIVAFGILVACGGKKAESETPVVEEDDIEVVETPVDVQELLIIVPEKGEVVEEQYSGDIPSEQAMGASYLLTFYYQQGGDGGVYGLTKTYTHVNQKNDKTEFSYGKREVIKGAPFDDNAIVYKLVPATGGSPLYFWANEKGLTKLDDQMKQYDSTLSYTLTPILK